MVSPLPTHAANPPWNGNFSGDWKQRWPFRKAIDFGAENMSVITGEAGSPSSFLRILYPKGTWSPKATRKEGLLVGGAQFYSPLCQTNDATLSYSLRFSPGFPFNKGGKLPGLYGGAGNTGGKIPTGSDGFSTRFMWKKQGTGILYPYLPTSIRVGSIFGSPTFNFTPGTWHRIEQHVRLNTPGASDGEVDVVLDGKTVLQQTGMLFRTVPDLQINGILFSTFFGGADESWAAPSDCTIDFADFTLTTK